MALSDIQALADPSLLVCPPNPARWDRSYIDDYWRYFQDHDQVLRGNGLRWIFTNEFLNYVLNEFPYSHIHEVPWVLDVMVDLEQRRQEFVFIQPRDAADVQCDHAIVPENSSEELKCAWHNLLVTCALLGPLLTRVASHPNQSIDRLTVSQGVNVLARVDIVNHAGNWTEVFRQFDPWLEANLPKNGVRQYEPPDYWRDGTPFPRGHSSRGDGYLDCRGCTWVWDRVEQHWDVQEPQQGFGNYERVTSDGRILP